MRPILAMVLLILLSACGPESGSGKWYSPQLYCYEVPKLVKRIIPLRAKDSHGGIDVEVSIQWQEEGTTTVCSTTYAPNK